LIGSPGWRRTYWSIWIANFLATVGIMSFLPFIPTVLEGMGMRDPDEVSVWSGLIFGAAPLAATFSGPIWGSLGDRWSRRLMVIRAMLGIAASVGLMYFARSPWQLLLLRVAQGSISGFMAPSITLVTLVAPEARQGRVTAELQTALAIGSILGPAFGGWMVATGRYSMLFPGVALLALLAAGLVMLLAEEARREVRAGSAGRHPPLLRELGSTLARAPIRAVIVLLLCLQFGLAGSTPLMELYVRDLQTSSELRVLLEPLYLLGEDDREVQAAATSLLFTVMAGGHLLFLPLWGRLGDAIGFGRALVLAGLGSFASLSLQAAASGYLMLLAGRALMGIALAGAGPLCFAVVTSSVPKENRGGAIGLVASARMLAVAVGGMAGGVVATWLGIDGFLWVSSIAVLLVLPWFWRRTRREARAAR
jgi:MFS family permease